jgi:hypothetical protein
MSHSPFKKEQCYTENRKDSNSGIHFDIAGTHSFPLQVVRENKNTKGIKKYYEIDERCDDQELEIRHNHMGILDYPKYTAKYNIWQCSQYEWTVKGKLGFLKPSVNEINRGNEDECVCDCFYNIIWLFITYRIDVIFVYEITNHP